MLKWQEQTGNTQLHYGINILPCINCIMGEASNCNISWIFICIMDIIKITFRILTQKIFQSLKTNTLQHWSTLYVVVAGNAPVTGVDRVETPVTTPSLHCLLYNTNLRWLQHQVHSSQCLYINIQNLSGYSRKEHTIVIST